MAMKKCYYKGPTFKLCRGSWGLTFKTNPKQNITSRTIYSIRILTAFLFFICSLFIIDLQLMK